MNCVATLKMVANPQGLAGLPGGMGHLVDGDDKHALAHLADVCTC